MIVCFLIIDSYRSRKVFKARMEALEEIIVHISKKQINQSNQLRILDDFDESLKHSRAALSTDIFKLNYELFDILSRNDLLKK